MTRGWIFAGPLAAALAAQDVSLPEEVAFGAAFEVVVTATAPFDVGALAPPGREQLDHQHPQVKLDVGAVDGG